MRIGSLCTGYGGLDMAVQAVYDGDVAWVSDIDKGACKILAHRYPGVPNLGDFTHTDWNTVEPVDILTAGFPCQPVSNAGRRLGDDDERWLWDDVARAVREVRPRLLFLENVRGLITAGGGRLFGRVVGSLADIGYDARWVGLPASDIDAPHIRFRIFIAANPRGEAWDQRPGLCTHEPARNGRRPPPRVGRAELLPTPRATDGTKGGPNQRGSSGDLMLSSAVAQLLPTPTSRDHKGPNQRGDATCLTGALLPTPDGAFNKYALNGNSQRATGLAARSRRGELDQWGEYAPAIARWERAQGRPAPPPTQLSSKGNPQLSARFVEWLMGLPAGHVTDVPGITRNEALKALGNGVVPQQAARALELLQ